MKIEFNLPVDRNLLKFNNLIKEGDIIQGDIVDIIGDKVILNIEKYGQVVTKSLMDMSQFKNSRMDYYVKEINGDTVVITPLYKEGEQNIGPSLLKEEENYLKSILKEYDIEEDGISMKFLKALSEYDVPINENTLQKGIKILDRVYKILNLKENENIINVNDGNDDFEEDIRNFVVIRDESSDDKEEKIGSYSEFKNDSPTGEKNVFSAYSRNLSHENVLIDKEDIKSKILTVKNDSRKDMVPNEDNNSLINDEVNDEGIEENGKSLFIENKIKSFFEDRNIDSNFIKQIAFMVKHNIVPSLRNIEFIMKIEKGERLFSENFLKSVEKIDISLYNELKKLGLNIAKLDGDEIKNYYEELNYKIELVNHKYLKSNIGMEEKEEIIKELNDKISFLNELNDKISFYYIPLYSKDERLGMISFLSKKGKEKKSNLKNITIFINLNMSNIGNVKVYCFVMNRTMDVNFNIDDDYYYLFKENEEDLKNKLMEKGFKINNITYTSEGNSNLFKKLIVNDKPFFYIDLKV